MDSDHSTRRVSLPNKVLTVAELAVCLNVLAK